MAALAVCAVTAADAATRNEPPAPMPTRPDQPPPPDPGLIPLTVAEIKRLFNLTPVDATCPNTTTCDGASGDAATKPARDGSTTGHDSNGRPHNEVRLPYRGIASPFRD